MDWVIMHYLVKFILVSKRIISISIQLILVYIDIVNLVTLTFGNQNQ